MFEGLFETHEKLYVEEPMRGTPGEIRNGAHDVTPGRILVEIS